MMSSVSVWFSVELANLTHRDDPVDSDAVPAVEEVLALDRERDRARTARVDSRR